MINFWKNLFAKPQPKKEKPAIRTLTYKDTQTKWKKWGNKWYKVM